MGIESTEVARLGQVIEPIGPANGRGHKATYSFRNLVEMQMFKRLNEFGIPWKQIQHYIEKLRQSSCHWLEEDGLDGWILADCEWRWAVGNTLDSANEAFSRLHSAQAFVAINLGAIKQTFRQS